MSRAFRVCCVRHARRAACRLPHDSAACAAGTGLGNAPRPAAAARSFRSQGACRRGGGSRKASTRDCAGCSRHAIATLARWPARRGGRADQLRRHISQRAHFAWAGIERRRRAQRVAGAVWGSSRRCAACDIGCKACPIPPRPQMRCSMSSSGSPRSDRTAGRSSTRSYRAGARRMAARTVDVDSAKACACACIVNRLEPVSAVARQRSRKRSGLRPPSSISFCISSAVAPMAFMNCRRLFQLVDLCDTIGITLRDDGEIRAQWRTAAIFRRTTTSHPCGRGT